MKILVINCSPVRNGATAEIVNTVKQCVENGNTVKTVCIDCLLYTSDAADEL